MSLYNVEIVLKTIVSGSDQQAAETAARLNITEIMDEPETEIYCEQINSRNEIPKVWLDGLPWGGDGIKKCEEYF